MAHRIEIYTKVNDTKSQSLQKKLLSLGFKIKELKVAEVYTINKKFDKPSLEKIAGTLSNSVSQYTLIDDYEQNIKFDFALEIGFLPGVTDNIATTAKEGIEDLLRVKFKENESVHTSTLIFIYGRVNEKDIQKIGYEIANNLIQRIHIKNKKTYIKEQGMDVIVPQVKIKTKPKTTLVNLETSKENLIKIGREGIADKDGTRRGPLALDLDAMEAIKNYFKSKKRKPTDIELESIAQTWSEHCKHTIFASEIDEVTDGLYKHYIKRATQEIRKKKGKKDFCVSVFSDNAGGIVFDENWIITDKAETHNSPSALDPFGGAITGIVGVNRDTIGFGKGSKPVINKYGFCVGYPNDTEPLFRDEKRTNPLLPPKRILEGVIDGVNAGGNQSGIPTPQGFVCFDDRFKGKPLVFVGTIGLIPKKIKGKNSWEKSAKAGDKIVVIGGRVGQDGIHGATFSSEALTSGSPATAVQIGDPITQKKLSDALIKEVRDSDLYSSITDNGAGGISCSVAEMAKECGGCKVNLEKVPLKYPNLTPWKIWISESQERMTLAVPPKNLERFNKIMKKHGVESTVIGEFTNSGKCVVYFGKEKIMDLDMEFLHDGIPKKTLKTTEVKVESKNPKFKNPRNLTKYLLEFMTRPNICSYEFISSQYDHNVQGGSTTLPLQGKGRVNSVATVTRPLLTSKKGVVCSQGINPAYSDISTYHMAACAIDTAIRNVVASGGNLNHTALMDNFCWCSSTESERLWQLKESARACYEFAVAYQTPYISGKDSMFNDFKGFDKKGKPIKISIPPTLLVSSVSVIDDATKSISLDTKVPGDLVYVIGETKEELGASEYFQYMNPKAKHNEIGENIPTVDTKTALNLYKKLSQAINKRLIASSLSPSIGGLAATFAKKAIAGGWGMTIDLSKVPGNKNLTREDYLLFSESQSRFVVTVDPAKRKEFEAIFKGTQFGLVGKVTKNPDFIIKNFEGKNYVHTSIEELSSHYKKTFKDY